MSSGDRKMVCRSFQIKRTYNLAIQKIINEQSQQEQNFTSPEDYYFPENIIMKNKAQKEPYQMMEIVEGIKKTSVKQKKAPKIDLDFLKCYWKKDYKQLSSTITGDKNRIDELPLMVTSYRGYSPKSLVHAKLLNDSNPSNEKFAQKMVVSQSTPKMFNEKQNFLFGDIKQRFKSTLKNLEDKKDKENKTFYYVSSTVLPKKVIDDNKTFQTQGHVFKGTNSKLTLRGTVYNNFETLIDQKKIFHQRHSRSKNECQIQDNQISLVQEIIEKTLSSSNICLVNKIELNNNQNLSNSSRVSNSRMNTTAEPPLIQQRNIYRAETSYVGSRKSCAALDKIQISNMNDSSKQKLEQIQIFPNREKKSTYECCRVKMIHLKQRTNKNPTMILVIYFEGVLGVHHRESFFKNQNVNQSNLNLIEFQKNFNLVHEAQNNKNIFYVYKQIKEVLNILSRSYLISLIFPHGSRLIEPIREYFDVNNINFDGIYSFSKQNCLTTDYTPMLDDFNFKMIQPTKIVIARPIDLEELVLIEVQEPQQQISQQELDPFRNYMDMLQTAHLMGSPHVKCDGLFPKASRCDQSKFRLIIVPYLTCKNVMEVLKFSGQIPTIKILEQFALAHINEQKCWGLLNKYKNIFQSLIFKGYLQEIQTNHEQNINKQIQYQKEYEIFMINAKEELKFDTEYVQDNVDSIVLNSKKRSILEYQAQIRNNIKRNKLYFTEDIINEFTQKFQSLMDDLYQKNKPIFRNIYKVRSQMKLQVDLYNQQKCQTLGKLGIKDEFKYCNEYGGMIVYNNLLHKNSNI